MNTLKKFAELNTMVADINAILSQYGINETISLADIRITDKAVCDGVIPSSILSEAIIHSLWPSIRSANVYHFTSREKAERILDSGIFRMTSLSIRYGEDEIKAFCETHGLQGYLDKDENGEPYYKSLLMPNTFYSSFADKNLTVDQEESLWQRFAVCDGVRLELSVTANNSSFRKMLYEKEKGKPIGLLSDLTSLIRNKYSREFTLKGLSSICAFYLPEKDYGVESEYRILHRVWGDSRPQPKTDAEFSYIELPLNTMSECGYQICVKEVHAREKPKMPSDYVFSKRKI